MSDFSGARVVNLFAGFRRRSSPLIIHDPRPGWGEAGLCTGKRLRSILTLVSKELTTEAEGPGGLLNTGSRCCAPTRMEI